MGIPVEYEWKKVGPEQDDRIMADGRPAYAWWSEIQMLRARGPELQKRQADILEQFRVLRIAEWALTQDAISDDIWLRIKRLPLILAKDPVADLLEHPEKYCTIEGVR